MAAPMQRDPPVTMETLPASFLVLVDTLFILLSRYVLPQVCRYQSGNVQETPLIRRCCVCNSGRHFVVSSTPYYAGSGQSKHHEIEWFFATTVGRMCGYHHRGIRQFI